MSRIECEEIPCPFCNGEIPVGLVRGCWTEKRHVTATFGARHDKRKTKDVFIIHTGCKNCGKSKEEIEKELKRKNMI
jgi:hypothetical protein